MGLELIFRRQLSDDSLRFVIRVRNLLLEQAALRGRESSGGGFYRMAGGQNER